MLQHNHPYLTYLRYLGSGKSKGINYNSSPVFGFQDDSAHLSLLYNRYLPR